MHRETIEHAMTRAREDGSRDYIDVYWHALNNRWPTPNERRAILAAGVYVAIPPGMRQEFPLRNEEREDLTPFEEITGWYEPDKPVSPYANTFQGILVGHKDAEVLYRVGLLDEKPGK